MNTALWIIAGLLASIFVVSGAMKVFRSRDELAASGMGVLADFGPGTVKTIGALELMAAAGLILPAALGLAPVLVPMAAAGLVLLMVGAAIAHLRRAEAHAVAVNLTLLALAVVVAWGRLGPHSFTA